MHVTLRDKLQLYLAGKDATWTGAGASWAEQGETHLLVEVDGPLTADAVIDAHVRAQAIGARLTLAHLGAPTRVALRTAERFRIPLLDASALPEPAAAPAPEPRAEPLLLDAPAEPAALLAAHVEPPVEDVFILAHDEPAPEVAHAEPDTPLPWDPSAPVPEVEPAHVEPIELLALPWIHEMDHHEELPAGRRTRAHHHVARATTAPQHHEDAAALRAVARAPDWGLPWPRPVAPTDGLSKADPNLWRAPERMMAMREDLARAGAPSFGAVKPEGSAWLKRISEFGAP